MKSILEDARNEIIALAAKLQGFAVIERKRNEDYLAAVAVLERRSNELLEREKSLANREAAIGQVRQQLSLARVEVKAAIERENAVAEKLAECRREKGSLAAQLTKIKTAFPALFETPAPAKAEAGAQ